MAAHLRRSALRHVAQVLELLAARPALLVSVERAGGEREGGESVLGAFMGRADGVKAHRSSRVMSTPTEGDAFRVSEISIQKCFMMSLRDVQPVCM